MSGPRSTFRGVVTELAIVVVGILIALGVDQALERRTERQLEAEYLRALSEDLTQNLVWFRELGPAVIERKTEAALAIEAAAGGAEVTDSVELAYQLLFVTAGIRSGVLTTTADDLSSTGNLRLLAADVRRGVVQYRLLGETLSSVENDLSARAGRAKGAMGSLLAPSLTNAIAELRWEAGPPWPPYDSLSVTAEIRGLAASHDLPGRLRRMDGLQGQLTAILDDLQEQRLWYAAGASVAERILDAVDAEWP